jgi:hypothetical protein
MAAVGPAFALTDCGIGPLSTTNGACGPSCRGISPLSWAVPFLDGLIVRAKRSHTIVSVGVSCPTWPAVLLLGGPPLSASIGMMLMAQPGGLWSPLQRIGSKRRQRASICAVLKASKAIERIARTARRLSGYAGGHRPAGRWFSDDLLSPAAFVANTKHTRIGSNVC